MSYDVWLQTDLGGPEPALLDGLDDNYTSNCSQMFLPDEDIKLRDLGGMPAADAAVIVRRAIAVMDADPDRFVAMNPENGWGDSEGFRAFLVKIADACEAQPRAVVGMSS